MGLLGLLVGCSSKSREAMDDAEALIEWNTDSALVLLQGVNPEDLGSRRLRARHALLLSMAMDGSRVSVTSDSVARVAYSYYLRRTGHKREKMYSAYCLAGVSYRLGEMANAIVLYHEALKYAEECREVRMTGYICQRIGELYALNYAHEDALTYASESVRLLEVAGDSVSADYSRIDVARQYMASGEMGKAESLTDSLLIEHPQSDEIYLYYLYVLKADLSYAEKEYDKALSYYLLAEGTGYLLPLHSMGRCALIQQRRGLREEADSLLNVMRSRLRTGIDSIVYYSIVMERADLQGDYHAAFVDMTLMDEIQNRSYTEILSQSASHAVKSYYEAQLEVEQVRRQSQRLFYTLVIMVLSVIIALIMIALRRHRQRIVTEMLRVEDLERDVQLLRANKSSSDMMIAAFVQDKIKTMSQLTDTYFFWSDDAVKKREEKEGRAMKEDVIDKFREEMKKLRNDVHLVSSIEDALNQTHDGIVQRLRADFSGLKVQNPKWKELDFQILVLFFAGFSNKSVSFLTELTDEAVRSRKKRYRQVFESMPPKEGGAYLRLLKREAERDDTILP